MWQHRLHRFNGQGCRRGQGGIDEKIEAAIRRAVNKPTGELTKADYGKVTELNLNDSQLTDVKGLEKLTQLKELYLSNNQLTDVKGLEKLAKLVRSGLS